MSEETAAASPEVEDQECKLETVPFDPRFPSQNQNQTKHCYSSSHPMIEPPEKSSKPQKLYYSVTGKDLFEMEIRQYIESITPTAPEALGSTSFTEKMGWMARACLAISQDPARYVDQLIKHEKHKVLVHEMVMITLWREEILPRLIQNCQNEQTSDGNGTTTRFCGSTVQAIFMYKSACCAALSRALERVEGAKSLGTAVLDVVDVSLLALCEFSMKMQDFIDSRSTSDSPCVDTCGTMAKFSIDNLLNLASHLDSLPEYVRVKMLHPNTQLFTTLIDLLNPDKTQFELKFNDSETDPRLPEVGVDHSAGKRETIGRLGDAERAATSFHGMPRKYSDLALQFYQYFEFCDGEEEICRWMFRLAKIIKLARRAKRPTTPSSPQPSPYHVSIRAELEEKKDAIVKIHGAMETFEAETVEKREGRIARDFGFIDKVLREKFCSKCKNPQARLRCSRCHFAYYCNRKCQSKDWAKHKLMCTESEGTFSVHVAVHSALAD